MANSPYSLRLDPELKARLEKHAERTDRSAAYIVQEALSDYLDNADFIEKELDKAEAELAEGVFISEEKMMTWFRSLGTDKELPPPEPDIFPSKDVSKDVA